ncbi:MAG: ABC transporter ATP-binding protein [Nostoc sp.]|uniref:ABC transporter ATP-binding protein n=1 Tax=Nostoc sp. TaxID=1180 RepID=UPI002FF80918
MAKLEPLITANSVQIIYKEGRHRFTAVEDVSFAVKPKEKFVIIGPSGCGKSSLLKAIAGFQPISSGELLMRGKKITSPGPDRMVVFQDFEQLLPWQTVRQNIVYALNITGKVASKAANEEALHYLNLVGVSAAVDKYPHQLSGGMKQRVAIARALAVKPQILLMDEPFAALDALTRTQLQYEVNAIWQNTGVTIILITHSIQEAVYLGHQVLVMTPVPGTVKEIVDTTQIDDINSKEFANMAAHLRSLLGTDCRSDTKSAREVLFQE